MTLRLDGRAVLASNAPTYTLRIELTYQRRFQHECRWCGLLQEKRWLRRNQRIPKHGRRRRNNKVGRKESSSLSLHCQPTTAPSTLLQPLSSLALQLQRGGRAALLARLLVSHHHRQRAKGPTWKGLTVDGRVAKDLFADIEHNNSRGTFKNKACVEGLLGLC